MALAPTSPLSPWRWFEGPSGPLAYQMALDEVLLEGRGDLVRPTLRLYRMEPPGLSLGWFQTLSDVPGSEGLEHVARRLTGGGAIHHGAELTFALSAPKEHPLYRGPVAESYARVHAILARALEPFGIHATLRGTRALASDVAMTGMCFQDSSALDLVWPRAGDGNLAKGVGSAQRRRGGRVLHHGSIKLSADPLEPGVATADAAGATADFEAVAASLWNAFADTLSLEREPKPPGASEQARALELARGYGDRTALQQRPRRDAALDRDQKDGQSPA